MQSPLMSKPGEWISLHFWVTPTHAWIEFDTNRHDSWLIVFNIMKRNNDERNTEKQQLSATVEVTCTELQASWKKSWLQVVFLFSWSLFWQTSLLSVTMKTERITDTTWWALPSSWASLKEFTLRIFLIWFVSNEILLDLYGGSAVANNTIL